jgi:hypothetical protein
MRRNRALLPLLLLLTGCAGLGTEITARNNRIELPHYSITVPPDEGWHLREQGGPYEFVLLVNEDGPLHFEMKLMRNTVLDASKRQASAAELADDFRDLEKTMMIEEGVKKGLYELEDVRTTEEVIGGKTFYVMSYLARGPFGTNRASLLLFFPKERDNESFLVAHFSEFFPANTVLLQSHEPHMVRVLESLEVR